LSRLEEITARLRQIADDLAGDRLDDERAAELTREGGELTAEASEEVNRALRGASSDE